MFASSFPLLDVFLSILWFFVWVLWIFLVFLVIFDVFRSHDIGGAAKAAWLIFVLIFPLLGVFVYLIARGGKMHERSLQSPRHQERAAAGSVSTVPGSNADQIARLADLKDRGALTEEEFSREKAKILAHDAGAPASTAKAQAEPSS